ncbi:MAG TPA: hypothetical protein ENI70_01690, partial [Candidatus Peregrinibacteria bacterium]|nr:hypothetical protein [Candidatus Peregrinibacteria bacterium]
MENYQENPENIERLEELLCKLGEKTSPPRSLSTGLRKKLIFHIEKEKESTVLKKVIQVLNLAQQVVRPGKDLVSRIRRRILDEISRPKPNWRESFSFVFDRRILAGATAFFLIFSLIYYSFENAPLISASKSAYLNLVEGVVFVKRDNEWKRLANNTELEKNDIVVTSSNSSAEIYFFDDSITRLNEKTEIQIKSLKSSQENPTQKSILIELHKGRIWSKAIHLLNEESSFNIQINNLLTTLNNAAVDIEHTPDEIRVTTAENFANIQVVDPWREITHKTKLTKNHEVKIPLRRSQLIVTNKGIPIKSVQKKTKEEEWFQENREKDKKHDSNFTLKKKLEAENKAGILPGSALYPAKKVVEQAKLALTFNKTARATAQLNIANTRLAEAVTLIEKGRNDSA